MESICSISIPNVLPPCWLCSPCCLACDRGGSYSDSHNPTGSDQHSAALRGRVRLVHRPCREHARRCETAVQVSEGFPAFRAGIPLGPPRGGLHSLRSFRMTKYLQAHLKIEPALLFALAPTAFFYCHKNISCRYDSHQGAMFIRHRQVMDIVLLHGT